MCGPVVCTKEGTLYLFMQTMHGVSITSRGIKCINCTSLQRRVIPCGVWVILQYYKTCSNTTFQLQSGILISLLLHRKERASSHVVVHAVKKSKKIFKVLYHLRWETFLLDLKFDDKHHHEHTHKDPDSQ